MALQMIINKVNCYAKPVIYIIQNAEQNRETENYFSNFRASLRIAKQEISEWCF